MNELDRRGKTFVSQFFLWTAIEFLACAVSAWLLGPLVPAPAYLALSVGLFAFLLIAGFLAPRYPQLSKISAILVPGILGVFLYATLNLYIGVGQGDIITLAAIGTAAIFAVTSAIAYKSKRSADHLSPILFALVCAMFLISLLNAVWLHLAFLSLVIAYVVLVIFTIYVYIDMQRVFKNARGEGNDDPASLALALFLDIYNIFISLLRIISSFR